MFRTVRRRRSLAAAAAVAVSLGLSFCGASAASAAAATLYVAKSGKDTAACTRAAPCATIQHAVDQAAGGDTVVVGPGSYPESVEVADKTITVRGSASGDTVVGGAGSGVGITVMGQDQTPTVTLDRLTVDPGSDAEEDGDSGVVVEHADVVLTDDQLVNNSQFGLLVLEGNAAVTGSLVAGNGAGLVVSRGNLTVTGSQVVANGGDAGGEQGAALGFGIGALDGARTSVVDSLVSGNDVGVVAGDETSESSALTMTGTTVADNERLGAVVATDTATIDNSTFADNGDAAVLAQAGKVSITRSTLTGTRVADGAVLDADDSGSPAAIVVAPVTESAPAARTRVATRGGGAVSGLTARIDQTLDTVLAQARASRHAPRADALSAAPTTASTTTAPSTAATTTASTSGGTAPGARTLRPNAVTSSETTGTETTGTETTDPETTDPGIDTSETAPTIVEPDEPTYAPLAVTVTGSIVAENRTPDCFGPVSDGGYNLSSDAADSCTFDTGKHSLTRTDPELGELDGNGGSTPTALPRAKGPAVDVIPVGVSGCGAGAVDQRGVARPQGPLCDIGAVEVKQGPLVVSPNSLPHGRVGQKYTARLSATGGRGSGYAFSLAPGQQLPPGLTLSAAGAITGTPTKAGTFTVTISVDDPVLKSYVIVIDPKAAVPTSTSPTTATSTSSSTVPVTTSVVSTSTATVVEVTTPPAPPPPPAPSLASTGTPAAWLTLWGALLLGAGLVFSRAATRRRPRREH